MAPEWMDYMLPFLQEAGIYERCTVVSGGKERYDSVKNALGHVETPWVAVHDAVRPFITKETVDRLGKNRHGFRGGQSIGIPACTNTPMFSCGITKKRVYPTV